MSSTGAPRGRRAETVRERELKFEAPTPVRVPDLRGLVDDVDVEQDVVRLASTYFDTVSLDLLALGVTLRSRAGDTDTGWQLKIPAGGARDEIRMPSDGRDTPPPEIADLLVGVLRGRPLTEITTLRTERRRTSLRRAGELVLEIADDRVEVEDSRHTRTDGWRELEAELGPAGTEDDLARVAAALRRAGARDSSSASKLGRALGRPTTRRTDGTATQRAVTDYLHRQLRALAGGDIRLRGDMLLSGDVRLSGETAAQGPDVHGLRVAVRRIRSVLRIFGELTDPTAAAALDHELRWYQDLLAAVREIQVQRRRIVDTLATLPARAVLGDTAVAIDTALAGEQQLATEALDAALRGNRYRRMLGAVATLAHGTPIPASVGRRDLEAPATRAARAALGTVRAAVARSSPAVDAGSDAAELHRARRAVKRARYALDLTGADPRRRAVLVRVQDVLGEHQDAVACAEVLARLGAAAVAQGAPAFTYGLLHRHEVEAAARARAEAALLPLR